MLIWQTLRGFFLGSRIKLLVSCQQMSFCCSWESSLRKSDGTKSSEPIPLPHFDFRPSTASSSRGRKPSGPSSRGRKPSGPSSRGRKPSGPSSRDRKPSGPSSRKSSKKKREKEKRRKERQKQEIAKKKKENEQELTRYDMRNLRKRQIFDTEMRVP